MTSLLYIKGGGENQNCMFWLGAVKPEAFQSNGVRANGLPSLHSPLFAPPPELTIKTGVTAMTAAMLEITGKK